MVIFVDGEPQIAANSDPNLLKHYLPSGLHYNAKASAARPTTAAAGPKLAAIPVLLAVAALPLMDPVAAEAEVPVADAVFDAALPETDDVTVAGSAAITPYAEQSGLGAVGQLLCA